MTAQHAISNRRGSEARQMYADLESRRVNPLNHGELVTFPIDHEEWFRAIAEFLHKIIQFQAPSAEPYTKIEKKKSRERKAEVPKNATLKASTSSELQTTNCTAALRSSTRSQ